MSNKIRTVKGPLGGRTFNVGSRHGANEIILTGPKRMTREQKFEFRRNQYLQNYSYSDPMQPTPYVKARYRIAMRVHQSGNTFVDVPCVHPDGSIFYEYIEGSAQ